MKVNKALKRLAKIESLLSDVAARFSGSAPHLQDVLRDLKAVIVRVREGQTTSAGAKKKTPSVKERRNAKKAAPGQKKSTAARAAKSAVAKVAKKPMPIKKAAKKRAAKRTAPEAAHRAKAITAEKPMPAAPAMSGGFDPSQGV